MYIIYIYYNYTYNYYSTYNYNYCYYTHNVWFAVQWLIYPQWYSQLHTLFLQLLTKSEGKFIKEYINY